MNAVIPMRESNTPLTDAIENETLAEYRYCEASFNAMAEHARDLERQLRAAQPIADEAAASLIECHGRRTDMEPGRWFDIAGEPVEDDAAYLESRGLLKRQQFAPTLVCLREVPGKY